VGYKIIVTECYTGPLILRVFLNRVLRRMCGPKRDEVVGGWRKLHDEELHNLYSSPSVIRMIKCLFILYKFPHRCNMMIEDFPWEVLEI
jgi:hypothetical protein